ncbi:hypothetical protein ISP17_18950 [Dyella ginsengisoli]|uniref:Uncharacterized protein n=1 Tax=Dyella ginsengisoli TaxID=363848 RepID=A0ABW8JY09_9GAMM
MMNLKQAMARRSGMAERAAALMAIHFPNFPEAWLWQRRKAKGFTTVPRTLPLAMEAIDHLSKGQPAGHTLFCLWARAPDGPLLVIENPATFAAEAGFTGARAVDTWRRRMKVLRDLQFLIPKKGPSGDFHYVLLLNPNVAVEYLRQDRRVQDELYGRFQDRLAEVGASAEMDAYKAFCVETAEAAKKAAEKQRVPPPPAETGSAARKKRISRPKAKT